MPIQRIACLLSILLLGLAAAWAAGLPNPFPAGCITIRTLPNGLRLVVREDHSLLIVSMAVAVRGGSGAGDTPGAAHYLEHLVLQGTAHYPGRLAPQYSLEEVGGVSEAVTSRDMTRIQGTVASSEARLLVGVLADVVTAALLDDESFTRERATVLTEIQDMTDDPLALLLNLGYQTSYHTHPYRFRTTGSIEEVLRLNAEDARACYQRRYVPNNMSVVLVGDITPEQALELVEEYFGKAKATEPPKWPVAEQPAGGEPVEGHIATDIGYTYQVMAFPTPSINNFYGTLATDLIMSLLTGGDDGLLLEQWKKDGIPVIDFGAEFVSSRAPGRLLIWAITEPGQARRLCRSTMNLLASLAAKPAPAETLALAKGRLAAELLMGNETYSQQAATLAFYEGLNGADALSRYIPAVEELTTEQVRVAMPTRLLAWITQGSRPE